MLGKRGPQRGLFEADTLYGEFVGRDTFYGWLAAQRDELFRDEDFAGLYVAGIGRPSVRPSRCAGTVRCVPGRGRRYHPRRPSGMAPSPGRGTGHRHD